MKDKKVILIWKRAFLEIVEDKNKDNAKIHNDLIWLLIKYNSLKQGQQSRNKNL